MKFLPRILVIFLAVVIGVGLAYWVYRNIEWYKEKEFVGFRGEAKNNYFLAGQLLLQKMGRPAEQYKELYLPTSLPSIKDSLLIFSDRQVLGVKRTEELIEWVKAGGHLIVTARPQIDNLTRRDFLLDSLKIKLIQNIAPKDEEPDSLDESNNDAKDGWQIAFYPYMTIKNTGSLKETWSFYDKHGVYAVQVQLGKGRLTVLSTMDIFYNSTIGEYDHADFLWFLAKDQSSGGTFRYVLYEDQISIGLWLWKHAWMTMVSLALLLLASIWYVSYRSGPILTILSPNRHRFMEHLQATGLFYWRQGAILHLVELIRKTLYQQLRFHHPDWFYMNFTTQCNMLSNITGISEEHIAQALSARTIKNTKHFLHIVKTLERLRKSI